MIIRKETESDYEKVKEVIQSAFSKRLELEDEFDEWGVVDAVRNSDSYINELSLVAEINDRIVGHVLFTPLTINDGMNTFGSLALGPVSVHRDFQNQGIGTRLVNAGILAAKKMGYQSVIVLVDYKYYSRFGFQLASKWHIGLDGDFNCIHLSALELVENGLKGVSGNIRYCPEFYNEKGELI